MSSKRRRRPVGNIGNELLSGTSKTSYEHDGAYNSRGIFDDEHAYERERAGVVRR